MTQPIRNKVKQLLFFRQMHSCIILSLQLVPRLFFSNKFKDYSSCICMLELNSVSNISVFWQAHMHPWVALSNMCKLACINTLHLFFTAAECIKMNHSTVTVHYMLYIDIYANGSHCCLWLIHDSTVVRSLPSHYRHSEIGKRRKKMSSIC